jgi:mannose-6-phosphate isomerase-like protein (cupin superfamily)
MKLVSSALAFIVFAAFSSAQTPPPAAPKPATQAARPRPKPQSIQVTVRDQAGTPIPFAHVVVTGEVSRTMLTNADGVATLQALPDGTYRLRFERDGFMALERDLTVRAGQTRDFEVQLTKIAEPAPPPAAHAPEPTTPAAAAPTPAAPSGPPVTLSIPGFLDKNFISGREPLKESVLGCTAGATTRLLQLREPIATHTHDQDEIIYVIAGDGAVRMRPSNGPGNAAPGDSHDEANVVAAGSLSIVPRGVAHSIERRGKNPLIVLSTLAGAPCQTPTTTHQAKR